MRKRGVCKPGHRVRRPAVGLRPARLRNRSRNRGWRRRHEKLWIALPAPIENPQARGRSIAAGLLGAPSCHDGGRRYGTHFGLAGRRGYIARGGFVRGFGLGLPRGRSRLGRLGAQRVRGRCQDLGVAPVRAQQPGAGLHDPVVSARRLRQRDRPQWQTPGQRPGFFISRTRPRFPP